MADELKVQDPDPPVEIRLWDAVISITCNDNADIELRGERPDVVDHLTRFVRNNLLIPGHAQKSDALRVATGISKAFGGEIVNLSSVRAGVRSKWIRLLKANLVGDPGQSIGQRMDQNGVST